MRRIFFILALLFPVLLFGQIKLFGTTTSPNDQVTLISSGAANTTSYWHAWDKWKEFEGRVGLWHAVYSYSDGISVPIYLSYRLRCGKDDTSNYRVTAYTLLDSLTTSDDTSVAYGTGDQVGQVVSLADQITNFSPNTEIQFKWNWTPSGADTAIIGAALLPVEIDY